METQCPNCGWSKKVPERAWGKKGKCPRCGTVFEIRSVRPRQQQGPETVLSRVHELEATRQGSERNSAAKSYRSLSKRTWLLIIGSVLLVAAIGLAGYGLREWRLDSARARAAREAIGPLVRAKAAFRPGVSYVEYRAMLREVAEYMDKYEHNDATKSGSDLWRAVHDPADAYTLIGDIWRVKIKQASADYKMIAWRDYGLKVLEGEIYLHCLAETNVFDSRVAAADVEIRLLDVLSKAAIFGPKVPFSLDELRRKEEVGNVWDADRVMQVLIHYAELKVDQAQESV